MSDNKNFDPKTFLAGFLIEFVPKLQKMVKTSEELQAVQLENAKLKNQLLQKAVKSRGRNALGERVAIIV